MRLSVLVGLAVLPLALAVGCHRNAEKALASPGVNGAPNILKEIADHPGSPWKAWRLRAYHVNPIWAGADVPIRAKITVWDDDIEEHDSPVAEFYFHDQTLPANANPGDKGVRRPYQLHFPSSMLGAAMGTLRNANEPVYLYFYENQWSIGIMNGETVGVD